MIVPGLSNMAKSTSVNVDTRYLPWNGSGLSGSITLHLLQVQTTTSLLITFDASSLTSDSPISLGSSNIGVIKASMKSYLILTLTENQDLSFTVAQSISISVVTLTETNLQFSMPAHVFGMLCLQKNSKFIARMQLIGTNDKIMTLSSSEQIDYQISNSDSIMLWDRLVSGQSQVNLPTGSSNVVLIGDGPRHFTADFKTITINSAPVAFSKCTVTVNAVSSADPRKTSSIALTTGLITNIYITDFSYYPTNIGLNQPVYLGAKFRFTAANPGNVIGRVTVDGQQIGLDLNVPMVNHDDVWWGDVYKTWTPTILGLHTINIIADPTNIIPESNENDNIFIQQLTVNANQHVPPVAVIGAIPSVYTNQIAQFQGSASYHPDPTRHIVTYAWSFGDGTYGTGVVSSHIYSSKGTYPITLTVTDDIGLNASTSSQIIIQNTHPVASAGRNVVCCENQVVTFDGSGSVDPDGSIVSYGWTFGQGNPASGRIVTHSYPAHGTYTTTLTVQDNDAATSSDTISVTVMQDPPLISISPTYGEIPVGESAIFKVSFDNPGLFNDYFDIGVAGIPIGWTEMPSGIFVQAGTVETVSLKITVPSDMDLWDNCNYCVYVWGDSANLSIMNTAELSLTVQATYESTLRLALEQTYSMLLNSTGNNKNNLNTSFTELESAFGDLLIYNKAESFNDSKRAIKKLEKVEGTSEIVGHLVGSIQSDVLKSLHIVETTSWSDSDKVSLGWSKYNQSIEDVSNGDNASAVQDLKEAYNKAVNSIHGKPIVNPITPGIFNQKTLEFSGLASLDIDGYITSYTWKFGDGTTGTGATVTHSYDADGDYQVKLIEYDNDGNKNSAIIYITVDTTPPIIGDLNLSSEKVIDGDIITIDTTAYDLHGVQSVNAYIRKPNGVLYKTVELTSEGDVSYTGSFDSSGLYRSYYIDIEASDILGNSGIALASGWFAVTYDVPAVTIGNYEINSQANQMLGLSLPNEEAGVEISTNIDVSSMILVTSYTCSPVEQIQACHFDHYVELSISDDFDSAIGSAVVKLVYDKSEFPAWVDESMLFMYEWNSTTWNWEPLHDCGVDKENNYVWANVDSIDTVFAIGYTDPDVDWLYVLNNDITINPVQLDSGDTVEIDAVIHATNHGQVSTIPVNFYEVIGGNNVNIVPTQYIDTIPAGGSVTLRIYWSTTVIGAHTIWVAINYPNDPVQGNNIASGQFTVVQYGVQLSSDSPVTQFISPGGQANYPIKVQNTGNVQDIIRLSVVEPGGGWKAGPPYLEVNLQPAQIAVINFNVNPDSDGDTLNDMDETNSYYNYYNCSITGTAQHTMQGYPPISFSLSVDESSTYHVKLLGRATNALSGDDLENAISSSFIKQPSGPTIPSTLTYTYETDSSSGTDIINTSYDYQLDLTQGQYLLWVTPQSGVFDSMPGLQIAFNKLSITKLGIDKLSIDTDKDGLNDDFEASKGLSPCNKDSDKDHFYDKAEINYWEKVYSLDESTAIQHALNPDVDSDGLLDGDEVNFICYGTDPTNPDSDNDGLSDGAEISHATNPHVADTDNDGMPDGWEVTYGLNPLVNDANGDKDGDGLQNLQEYLSNADPTKTDTDSDGLNDFAEVVTHGTLPNDPDSDADGMPDGWEVNYALNPLSSADASLDGDSDGLTNVEEYQTGTNPGNHDTDGDSLWDGDELGIGDLDGYLNLYITDPTKSDTDSDGINDGTEAIGTVQTITQTSTADFSSGTCTHTTTSNDKVQLSSSGGFYYSSGTYISTSFNQNNNLAAVLPAWNVDLHSQTLTLYLSNNNGVDWYTSYAGHRTVFPSKGNCLKYKLEFSTTDTLVTPVLYDITLTCKIGYETDPTKNDTDGDGLWDGDELNPLINNDGFANPHGYITNPCAIDTDLDGASDGWEMKYGFNPTDGGDLTGDSDGDHLSNINEYYQGTDPSNPDTDGDKLPDGLELGITGSGDLDTATTTNPRTPDSDGDGLWDGWQDVNKNGIRDSGDLGEDINCNGRVDSGETDPNHIDTDNDGISDFKEITEFYKCDRVEAEDYITNYANPQGNPPIFDPVDHPTTVTLKAWPAGGTTKLGYDMLGFQTNKELKLKAEGPGLIKCQGGAVSSQNIQDEEISGIIKNAPIFEFTCFLGGNWVPIAIIGETRGTRFVQTVGEDLSKYWTYEGTIVVPQGATGVHFTLKVDTSKIGDVNNPFHNAQWLEITADYFVVEAKGLNPTNDDCDGDGLKDGAELEKGTSPWNSDIDKDGIKDPDEIDQGTNPDYRDTDYDGIRDRIELGYSGDTVNRVSYASAFERAAMVVYSQAQVPPPGTTKSNDDGDSGTTTTDPLCIDTDSDGAPDGYVPGWSYDSATDQYGQYNDVNDKIKGEDLDLDGARDKDANNNWIETSPKLGDSDTDSDGMPDGWEKYYSLNPLVNDASNDADNDLNNLKEYRSRTDPNVVDTDSDSFTDSAETYSLIYRTNVLNGAFCGTEYGASGTWMWFAISFINKDHYKFTVADHCGLDPTGLTDITFFAHFDDGTEIWLKNDATEVYVIPSGSRESAGIYYIYNNPVVDNSQSTTLAGSDRNLVIFRSDPRNPDTDMDGIKDGAEAIMDISSSYDMDLFGSYRDQDSDGDGLTDGQEDINKNGVWEPALGETDPTKWDTDGDGTNDKLDVWSDGSRLKALDKDNDGLTGCTGFSGQENQFGTLNNNVDTDGDGLWDGDEVFPLKWHLDSVNSLYKTDPTKSDTDSDGLWDGVDIVVNGVQKYGELTSRTINVQNPLSSYSITTDPTKFDSDNDGLLDGTDITIPNTDPRYNLFVGTIYKTGNNPYTFYGEKTYTTDSMKIDTDGGGATDKQEKAWVKPAPPPPPPNNLNPLDLSDDWWVNPIDNDHDGMPDSWEGKYFDPSGNPRPPNQWNQGLPGHCDPNGDADNDGWDANGDGVISQAERFTNYQEYLKGTIPVQADTDSDGMPDGWEIYNGLNPNYANDAKTDLDKDGLTNAGEYMNHGNPNIIDTDSDSLWDGAEVTKGTKVDNSDTDHDFINDYKDIDPLRFTIYNPNPKYFDNAPTEIVQTQVSFTNPQCDLNVLVAYHTANNNKVKIEFYSHDRGSIYNGLSRYSIEVIRDFHVVFDEFCIKIAYAEGSEVIPNTNHDDKYLGLSRGISTVPYYQKNLIDSSKGYRTGVETIDNYVWAYTPDLSDGGTDDNVWFTVCDLSIVDYDNDNLPSSSECIIQNGVSMLYRFESEDHVGNCGKITQDSKASNYYNTKDNAVKSDIYKINNRGFNEPELMKVDDKIVEEGNYQVYIRARCDWNALDYMRTTPPPYYQLKNIFLGINYNNHLGSGGTSHLTEAFALNGYYEWYSLPVISVKDDFSITLLDLQKYTEAQLWNLQTPAIYVDKLIIIKSDDNIISEFNGQYTDPLCADSDGDTVNDGIEYNSNIIYTEAEYSLFKYCGALGYIRSDNLNNGGSIILDETCGNNLSVRDNGQFVVCINPQVSYKDCPKTQLPYGSYYIYIRARTNEQEHGQIDVNLICKENSGTKYSEQSGTIFVKSHVEDAGYYNWQRVYSYSWYGLRVGGSNNNYLPFDINNKEYELLITLNSVCVDTIVFLKCGEYSGNWNTIDPIDLNIARISNPLSRDTDKDGLTDSTELNDWISIKSMAGNQPTSITGNAIEQKDAIYLSSIDSAVSYYIHTYVNSEFLGFPSEYRIILKANAHSYDKSQQTSEISINVDMFWQGSGGPTFQTVYSTPQNNYIQIDDNKEYIIGPFSSPFLKDVQISIVQKNAVGTDINSVNIQRQGICPISDDMDRDGLGDYNDTYKLWGKGTSSPFLQDFDEDGIPDGTESSDLTFFHGDPTIKDIFVEVDNFKPLGTCLGGHILMPEAAKLAVEALARCNIRLWIDGDWPKPEGGSDVLLNHDDATVIWDNNDMENKFYDTWFTPERHHIYHYCLIAHDAKEKDHFYGGYSSPGGDWMVLGDENIKTNHIPNYINFQAHTFIHELGHNLGLNADWLYDHDWGTLGIQVPISPSTYPSCMAYDHLATDSGFIDYSSHKGIIETRYINTNDNDPDYDVSLNTDDVSRLDLVSCLK
jgi:chitodextrinase